MAIPISKDVKINPGVLAAGGTALDLNGLILTDSAYAPVGSVLSFSSDVDVEKYFGSSSQEAAMATIYFSGYKNSTKQPGIFCTLGSTLKTFLPSFVLPRWRM